ncbi:MAG: insulinase family protein [Myxococcales bacterium]|nr:insulinase family protein [Myxococcales bacterium]USN51307.1 MAG: insulinase family protein [Myxococcales bacterium]
MIINSFAPTKEKISSIEIQNENSRLEENFLKKVQIVNKSIKSIFRYLSCNLLMISLLFSIITHSSSEDFKIYAQQLKSEQRNKFPREEQYIRLANGLEVLVIQTSEAKQSSVSMSVNVGFWDEPSELRGIAHYLEHMLFLGTKKYPDAKEYGEYISKNNGIRNASTTEDNTNYYFSINDSALEGALDRFSRFFYEPSFNINKIDDELEIIESEYQKNCISNMFKLDHIKKLLSNPKHPMQRSFQGNKETLSKITADALFKFYKKNYTADRMKLVVISSLSTQSIIDMVQEKFSKISSGQDAPNIALPPLYNNEDLPRIVEWRPEGKDLQMNLLFQTSFFSNTASVYNIITNLLNRRDIGSLNDKLKSNGLIVEMNAGRKLNRNQRQFLVNFILTPQGKEKWQDICKLFFSYINELKKEGLSKLFYQEAKNIYETNYLATSLPSSLAQAKLLANYLHRFTWDELEGRLHLLAKPDENEFFTLLNEISPSKMQVFLTSDELSQKSIGVKVGEFYGAFYRESKIDDLVYTGWMHANSYDGSVYPKPNRFIPEAYDCRHQGAPEINITEQKGCCLCIKTENVQEQSVAKIQVEFYTDRKNLNIETVTCAVLFKYCFNQFNAKWNQDARKLGFSDSIDFNSDRVKVYAGGPACKIIPFIKEFSLAIKNISLSENEFKAIKETIINNIEAYLQKTMPYSIAYKNTLALLSLNSFPTHMYLEPIEKLELSDVKEFFSNITKVSNVLCAAYGDIKESEAADFLNSFLSQHGIEVSLNNRSSTQEEIKLDPGKTYYYKIEVPNDENAYCCYYQLGENTPLSNAALHFGKIIIGQKFFDELRTKQKLAYIAQAFGYWARRSCGFVSLIQSKKNIEQLSDIVDEWMGNAAELISGLSSEEFEKIRSSILEEKRKPDESFSEKSSTFFSAVFYYEKDFEWKEKEIKAIESITQDEVVSLFREMLDPKSAARIVVHVVGKESEACDSENFQPLGTQITDFSTFRQQVGRYSDNR